MRIMTATLGAMALFASVLGAQAQAIELASASGLKSFQTADDARGWDAVGRVNLGERGFCTGALIAPDLVLTAGHCLFDKHTGRRYAPSEITFLAGWRDGRAEAYRGARRAMTHPAYDPLSNAMHDIGRDIALIELDHPIRNGRIQPFPVYAGPADGDAVGIVSYARERADRPTLQEVCHIKGHQDGALIMSCAVDFGASGAPVFAMTDDGPRIVSVVSAMAEVQSEKVSIGTALGGALDELTRLMAASDGVFHRAEPQVKTLNPDDARKAGTAKFLRPG
ncbi:trypsin-like serine peptidase [Oceaniglobus indicus]|uniref:trypsin-like serine peptidase n=1 Tax=Oceaniglobus indicus TaxID=2047749 RepID=UPI000C1939BE|nr:trypsin-like serine protease [Oceaniglobus indicus]